MQRGSHLQNFLIWNKGFVFLVEVQDDRDRDRYLVVRAGQAGTALQPVDINNRKIDQKIRNFPTSESPKKWYLKTFE